jgi:hypothetical protein
MWKPWCEHRTCWLCDTLRFLVVVWLVMLSVVLLYSLVSP